MGKNRESAELEQHYDYWVENFFCDPQLFLRNRDYLPVGNQDHCTIMVESGDSKYVQEATPDVIALYLSVCPAFLQCIVHLADSWVVRLS